MRSAVLTAVYDNYDALKLFPAQDIQCETICVTDNPNLTGGGWDRIVYEPRENVHPNRAAKTPKMCPWRYTDADITVWIDASFEFRSSSFVRELCAFLPIGQFAHPDRDCIYTEGLYSAGLGKYAGEPLSEQMFAYASAGHPENWGLWATGLIVRERSRTMENFGEAWLDECWRWSFQDQVSEAPMLRDHGLRPNTIPGGYSLNPWVQYAGSSRH
jgi:hypothetical protein